LKSFFVTAPWSGFSTRPLRSFCWHSDKNAALGLPLLKQEGIRDACVMRFVNTLLINPHCQISAVRTNRHWLICFGGWIPFQFWASCFFGSDVAWAECWAAGVLFPDGSGFIQRWSCSRSPGRCQLNVLRSTHFVLTIEIFWCWVASFSWTRSCLMRAKTI